MYFAYKDYGDYRSQRHRFSERNLSSSISLTFGSEDIERSICLARPGDMIFLLTQESLIAWLVTYLSAAEFSHAAILTNDNTVIHATLSGIVEEPILDALEGTRFLFLRPPARSTAEEAIDRMRSLIGTPYGKRVALGKAVRVLVGRNWPKYRRQFFYDFTLSSVFVDMIIWPSFGYLIATPCLVAYAGILGANALAWRLGRRPSVDSTILPSDLLFSLTANGWELIGDREKFRQNLLSTIQMLKDHSQRRNMDGSQTGN